MTTQNTDTPKEDRTIRLAEHLAFSRSFQPLFNEGMALVDETAVYLDGAGRVEAKAMSKAAATLYAAESMRLTTRLMQVASWLLLQRAANQLSAEVQRRAMQMATILEPLLIVTMGLVVMLIVLAVLMPIIQLNQWVR